MHIFHLRKTGSQSATRTESRLSTPGDPPAFMSTVLTVFDERASAVLLLLLLSLELARGSSRLYIVGGTLWRRAGRRASQRVRRIEL